MQQKSKVLTFPIFLVCFETAAYLSNDMYLPALPQIMRDLQVVSSLALLSLTTWLIGGSSMQLLLGPISDRFGRRPILLIGGVIFIASTLLCAMATNIWLLLFARFAQGTTVCFVVVAGYSAVHECFATKEAVKTLAWMSSITILAPAFGPLLGGIVLSLSGSWRLIFWLLTGWALVAISMLAIYMPETNLPQNRHPLEIKTLLKNYLNILTNPHFNLITLIFCLLFIGMIAWIAAGPFLVIDVFHYDALMFGVFQALIFGTYMVTARVLKRFMDKLHLANLIKQGIIIILFAVIISELLAIVFPHWLIGLIISLMIYACGFAFMFSPLQRMAIDACGEPMGAKVAVFSMYMGLAAALASILVSIFFNGQIISLTTILVVVGLLAYIANRVFSLSGSSS